MICGYIFTLSPILNMYLFKMYKLSSDLINETWKTTYYFTMHRYKVKKKLLLIKSCGGPLLIRWGYKIIYSYTRRLCEFSTMCYEHSGDSNGLKKLFIWMKIHGLTQNSYSPNVSTTPLRQWGFRQCLSFSWTSLRGKHCRHPIAVMGVVDIKTRSVYSVCQGVRADVRPQWVL